MSEFRVKIKDERRHLGPAFVTWELQERVAGWETMDPDLRDEDEWEYLNFGEALNDDEAITEARKALKAILQERKEEAEARYVTLEAV